MENRRTKRIMDFIDARKTSDNSRLSQWGLMWLNKVQCFYQHLRLIDNVVLQNSPLRQAAKRYIQF